jgi:protein-disulfide isomerase
MKKIITWLSIVIVFLAIIWGLISLVNSSGNNSLPQTKTPKSASQNDITLGATQSARVTLIEYADFECSACANYAPIIEKLNKDFANSLLIICRFFPLINSHPNSLPSAQTAYAAYRQNKFWEMNELLYKNQNVWGESKDPLKFFTDYAKTLKLNLDQFTKDYDADATKQFINAQREEGLSIGITYTPSFFVNGKLIQSPQDYDGFKQIIQNEIKKIDKD